MEIKALAQRFSICKLADFSDLKKLNGCWFMARTDEEISLVCAEADVPPSALVRSDGWRGFRIEGTLDFSLIGVLARLSAVLAQSGIGIFAVSTYNTDYILTKAEDFPGALEALERAGYRVM